MTANLIPNEDNIRMKADYIKKYKNIRSLKCFYIFCSITAISAALCILAFVAYETLDKTDRQTISGADKYRNNSVNNVD